MREFHIFHENRREDWINNINEFLETSEKQGGLNKKLQKKIKKQKIGKSTRKCIFCMEAFQKEDIIKILPCRHYFHNKCLKPWFNRDHSCPTCRFDLKSFLEEDESLLFKSN